MIMAIRGGRLLILCIVLLEYCCLGLPWKKPAQDDQIKAEAALPINTMSPPEGNTTFLGGTTWCVALRGAPQIDLQNALDWACGLGRADCRAIQNGGDCFRPDTLLSHASYAFNSYYQQNGNSDVACNFGGTAALTTTNPSYDKCVYATSGSKSSNDSSSSSAAPFSKYGRPNLTLWTTAGILLLLYSMTDMSF